MKAEHAAQEMYPGALQPVARPEVVGPHDSLHARRLLLGVAASGTLEAPAIEPGGEYRSAAPTAATLDRKSVV